MKSAIERRDHLRRGSRECQCPICDLYLLSPRSFELHRTGKGNKRHCMTPRELRAKGWKKDAKGRWGYGIGMGAEAGGAGDSQHPR